MRRLGKMSGSGRSCRCLVPVASILQSFSPSAHPTTDVVPRSFYKRHIVITAFRVILSRAKNRAQRSPTCTFYLTAIGGICRRLPRRKWPHPIIRVTPYIFCPHGGAMQNAAATRLGFRQQRDSYHLVMQTCTRLRGSTMRG